MQGPFNAPILHSICLSKNHRFQRPDNLTNFILNLDCLPNWKRARFLFLIGNAKKSFVLTLFYLNFDQPKSIIHNRWIENEKRQQRERKSLNVTR